MAEDVRRITLALLADLLEQIDKAVQAGSVRSRNAFIIAAIRHELAARETAAIDADFALMAIDSDYLAESDLMTREFAIADWEAFRLGESATERRTPNASVIASCAGPARRAGHRRCS